MTESIIVTGGLGFIGSNFIHHITATRHDVKITNVDYQESVVIPPALEIFPRTGDTGSSKLT